MWTGYAEASFASLSVTALVSSEPDAMLVGQQVNHLETNIVACGGVFGPGVAEADHQPRTSGNLTTPQEVLP